ncbi:hypothetical protein TNCV_2362691 [Trichonephila clavipes]|nr:hypothetical protein TNCV_2362691 [Trichonephila clavipes]
MRDCCGPLEKRCGPPGVRGPQFKNRSSKAAVFKLFPLTEPLELGGIFVEPLELGGAFVQSLELRDAFVQPLELGGAFVQPSELEKIFLESYSPKHLEIHILENI